jgi:hypothetical protein
MTCTLEETIFPSYYPDGIIPPFHEVRRQWLELLKKDPFSFLEGCEDSTTFEVLDADALRAHPAPLDVDRR